ncbi:Triosephosphate isomerase [Roseovarius sp. THAF27]|uniref:triose-phosphate isomerase n=1 Tax=Roseovarius sp. THAF27 TaxID=2587850 RepID=UPI001268E6D8|nr:triose-phosphate isomerase [Roseovarius sp. THAF27]QFT80615.1 Triosephosphate isomerase [Roseovarius sp. THAF27]
MARKLAAGNWKMNGTRGALQELSALAQAHPDPSVDILICPPATLIHPAAALMADASVQIGGQDCHAQVSGAHTGDISAQMLADAGATSVILGHSERREDHGESSDAVNAKIRAVHAAGLVAIVCVGESLAQRESASTLEIIGGQLAASLPDACTAANTVIAYEPIWAIGTGRIPTTDQIDEVHDFIRADMIRRFGAEEGGAIPLLYGGSVKPDNAAEIFATDNVDGALVGGASLKAADFSPIIKALEQST